MDVNLDHSFTDDHDIFKANTTAHYSTFQPYFTMNLPCVEYFNNQGKLPMLMDAVLWANFSEDTQAFIQIYGDMYGDLEGYVPITDTANSITISESSSSSTQNTTEITYYEYSDDGICSNFTHFSTRDVLSESANFSVSSSNTLTRIPTAIAGFQPTWFGLIVGMNIIGLIGVLRARRK